MNELHLKKYKGQTKLTRAKIRYKIIMYRKIHTLEYNHSA
jgi:hypothetical protein